MEDLKSRTFDRQLRREKGISTYIYVYIASTNYGDTSIISIEMKEI